MDIQYDFPEKMMNYFCNACQEVFAMPSRRGRPPKYCTKCIDGGFAIESEELAREARLRKAEARIDNLELMLKSNGTHLSQNQHRWE